MTYKEIAEELGISVKTVENQMGRALRILKELLKDQKLLLWIILFRIFDN
jgi:RNA polymerase sigma-70 factor (ECF subfamily)